ncbi:MAG: hypothetical protein ACHBN1_18615 [Heteroscytonema crispum UTEX LB 1556]
MKQYLGFGKRFFLLVTPLIATSTLFASPSQAATFALSEGNLNFTDINGELSIFRPSNNANTLALANGGTIFTENRNVQNELIASPLKISSSASSVVFGESKDYLGTAETEGRIVSNFDVDAGKPFSFNFNAGLNQVTAIDDPTIENAKASGDVSFFLLDTTDIATDNLDSFIESELISNTNSNLLKNPLDFFSLTSVLNTRGNDDFVIKQFSKNIKLFQQDSQFQYGGNQEFARTLIGGFLERVFDKKANLTLLAVRRTQTRVTAPEPSTSLALLLFSVLIAIATKSKRQTETSISLSSIKAWK